MGKKDQPSKISLRSSLFPHVSPYIDFTSVVHKDLLPFVSWNLIKVQYSSCCVQTLSVAAPEGLDQFNSVNESLLLAGLDVRREIISSTVLVWACGANMEKEQNETDFSNLRQNVKINQLPGQWILGRKDCLARCYQAVQPTGQWKGWDFQPKTFLLPQDAEHLEEYFQKKRSIFIIKPVNWFSGLGIKITNKLEDIPLSGGKVVAQEYIERPLLIDGRKFDVRVFLLVTSLDPLQLYIYDDGVVSVCTEEYSSHPDTLPIKPVHLTNYNINKTHQNFSLKKQRLKLTDLWTKLRTDLGVDTETVWRETKEVCLATVLSGLEQLRAEFLSARVKSSYNCFKLFAFDILYDQQLKPWLLEVGFSF